MAAGHLCTKRKELSRYTIKKTTKKRINLLPLFALEKKKTLFLPYWFLYIYIIYIYIIDKYIYIWWNKKKYKLKTK